MKSFATYKVMKEHEGLTLEEYLKTILQYSGRKIQKLTRQKGILLNGKKVFLQRKVKSNDVLRVLMAQDMAYGVEPEEGSVEILYEDDYMLVLNKPAYQLVHPTGQTTKGTLANYLAYHLQQQGIITTIRPVHRLDRETSGCVIFAKDDRSQFILEQQLKDRTLKRVYWALVKGIVHPPSATIDVPIGFHPTMANRRAVKEKGDPAITHYHTLHTFSETSLIELRLDTGRTHQIRVHLAHIGYPLLGDGMYGIRTSWLTRQALHASSVSFHHVKDQNEITVQAPLPPDLTRAVDFCRSENS
ncbi:MULTISPECIES: RluA family pseudouridine synthase [Pelosinus]|uniref:Pseudouridine synthase n=1 Tax=Pelosinus fermentans B4 TaxID=1149862 RepID=I9LIE1_9FIRM|nr:MULTISPECIES: RluA family pseudouridine synthase [Pelosinus]EIW20279.1 pseudouridine synthase, RluA family [Pelosinus fermentans B4]EIW25883.1 pseudouridine synthase, RluA family [Pelosinus fermentans A11]OAM93181.1 pseudouridine synthase, RluA family [Pelosinus fermentans DSM 17108]SDQ69538.1 23S rRNA pseudouridine1911/1915/1917 synthase [Pelosinus fermentans]